MYNKDRAIYTTKLCAKFYDKDPHRNITIGTTFDAKTDQEA